MESSGDVVWSADLFGVVTIYVSTANAVDDDATWNVWTGRRREWLHCRMRGTLERAQGAAIQLGLAMAWDVVAQMFGQAAQP